MQITVTPKRNLPCSKKIIIHKKLVKEDPAFWRCPARLTDAIVDFLIEVLVVFTIPTQRIVGIVPRNRPQPLLTIPFSVHSQIIFTVCTTNSVIKQTEFSLPINLYTSHYVCHFVCLSMNRPVYKAIHIYIYHFTPLPLPPKEDTLSSILLTNQGTWVSHKWK
jgi:hypothetical protein